MPKLKHLSTLLVFHNLKNQFNFSLCIIKQEAALQATRLHLTLNKTAALSDNAILSSLIGDLRFISYAGK